MHTRRRPVWVEFDPAAEDADTLSRRVVERVREWQENERAYFERYGLPRDHVFLTPYEPDYEQIERVTPAMVADARARFGLDPARRFLLFSGRLDAEKRVDLLIEAFAAVIRVGSTICPTPAPRCPRRPCG